MKRILCSLVILCSVISVCAQSKNACVEMQPMVQKIDSLEHELSFLKLSYELNSLNSDLITFANEVYAKSVDIKLDIYAGNFDLDLGAALKESYISNKNKQEAFQNLIDAKKEFFALKVMTYPFTEGELKTLESAYNVIDAANSSLNSSMEIFKILVDEYRKRM